MRCEREYWSELAEHIHSADTAGNGAAIERVVHSSLPREGDPIRPRNGPIGFGNNAPMDEPPMWSDRKRSWRTLPTTRWAIRKVARVRQVLMAAIWMTAANRIRMVAKPSLVGSRCSTGRRAVPGRAGTGSGASFGDAR